VVGYAINHDATWFDEQESMPQEPAQDREGRRRTDPYRSAGTRRVIRQDIPVMSIETPDVRSAGCGSMLAKLADGALSLQRSDLQARRSVLAPAPLRQAGVPANPDDNVVKHRDPAHVADLSQPGRQLDVLP
jgi:hypothetical protein